MTNLINSIEDIASLKESAEIEFKLAGGRDGQGEIPKDVWKTFSAMANTNGGDIFLGIQEKPIGQFKIIGVTKADKMIADLWNTLNSAKISTNYLDNNDIQQLVVNDKVIIHIHVPRAGRRQKPIYLNGNPLQGTYRRLNEGDHLCDRETVSRMMAEQIEDSRDSHRLEGYDLEDVDMDSLHSYRQMLQNLKPTHPFNAHDDQEFLRLIGGWVRDRKTKEAGLTLAGLLMFGKLSAIHEAMPNYLLDYQERTDTEENLRWADRVTLDGTWSGNLFDFYRKVINKLTADLKIPFRLEDDGYRKDQTPAHEALREALVNTLVHADFTGRPSVRIIKRSDRFSFRNPGLMRVPVELAIQGGESDCRNRNIHQMFLLVGLGERAGSGIPKIYSSWRGQSWRQPLLSEKADPEQTLLNLQMISLLPPEALSELMERFGDRFEKIGILERIILVTAHLESTVCHSRLQEISDKHPRDISRSLQQLVKDGFLSTSGSGRGTTYYLPDSPATNSDGLETSSDGLEASSDGLKASSDGLEASSDGLKGLEQRQDGLPMITDLANTDQPLRQKLVQLTKISKEKKKLPKTEMESIIMAACRECYLSLRVLAELLGRSPDPLRQSYLNRMVKEGKLRRAFPREPNSPKQAYTSAQCAVE